MGTNPPGTTGHPEQSGTCECGHTKVWHDYSPVPETAERCSVFQCECSGFQHSCRQTLRSQYRHGRVQHKLREYYRRWLLGRLL